MIDWNGLVALKLVAPTSAQSRPGHEAWGYKPPVSFSSELRRVLSLPRRALELDGTERAETIIDRPALPLRRARSGTPH
jgi:hypothetical protein